MKQKLTFTPIDLHRWSRGEALYYFSRMAPTGYSLTAELDITTMRRTLKQAGHGRLACQPVFGGSAEGGGCF